MQHSSPLFHTSSITWKKEIFLLPLVSATSFQSHPSSLHWFPFHYILRPFTTSHFYYEPYTWTLHREPILQTGFYFGVRYVSAVQHEQQQTILLLPLSAFLQRHACATCRCLRIQYVRRCLMHHHCSPLRNSSMLFWSLTCLELYLHHLNEPVLWCILNHHLLPAICIPLPPVKWRYPTGMYAISNRHRRYITETSNSTCMYMIC